LNKSVSEYYSTSNRELAQRYIGHIKELGTREYFEAAVAHRYSLYPEIPRIAAFNSFAGERVLEIGVGQGADHFMFAKAGSCLAGTDITEKHCRMTRDFLRCFGYSSNIQCADACKLPFVMPVSTIFILAVFYCLSRILSAQLQRYTGYCVQAEPSQ